MYTLENMCVCIYIYTPNSAVLKTTCTSEALASRLAQILTWGEDNLGI